MSWTSTSRKLLVESLMTITRFRFSAKKCRIATRLAEVWVGFQESGVLLQEFFPVGVVLKSFDRFLTHLFLIHTIGSILTQDRSPSGMLRLVPKHLILLSDQGNHQESSNHKPCDQTRIDGLLHKITMQTRRGIENGPMGPQPPRLSFSEAPWTATANNARGGAAGTRLNEVLYF